MPWAKVDDGWWCHPKVLGASNGACGLWIRALSWSCHQRRDIVPPSFVALIGGTERETSELVERSLWVVVPGGWRIHDWSEYQEQTLSEKRAEAGAKGGRSTRRDPTKPKQTDVVSGANGQAGPIPTRPFPTRPVVVSPTGRDASQHRDDNDQTYRGLDLHHVWQRIAGWKADAKTQRPNARWLKSVARNQPDDEHPDGGTYAERARAVLDCWAIDDPTTLAEVLYGRRQLTHVPRRLSA